MSCKDKNKRYHIVSDAELGWHDSFVEAFDCENIARSRLQELAYTCDPYEVLTIKDTLRGETS